MSDDPKFLDPPHNYPTLTLEQSIFVEAMIRHAFNISPAVKDISEKYGIHVAYTTGKYWVENGRTKEIIEAAKTSAQNTAIRQVTQVAQQVTQTIFLNSDKHRTLINQIIEDSLITIKDGVNRARVIINGSTDREPGTDRNAIDAIRAVTGALETVAEMVGVKQQIVQSVSNSTTRPDDGESVRLLREALLGNITGEQPAIPAAQQPVVEIQAQNEPDPLSHPVQPFESGDAS